jgi:hypothetical protein
MRPGALDHPVRSQRDNRRTRVIGEYASISCRPPTAELWPIEHGRENGRRTYGTYNLRDIIDLGEILTDEEDKRNAVPQFDELESTARDLHRFPPTNVGVKGTPKVVLINLVFVQRPSMVLILTDMKPPISR